MPQYQTLLKITRGLMLPVLSDTAELSAAALSPGTACSAGSWDTVCSTISGTRLAAVWGSSKIENGISSRSSTSAHTAYWSRRLIFPRKRYLSAMTMTISADEDHIHSLIALLLGLFQYGVQLIQFFL